MPKIHVHTPFTLTRDDGTATPFAAGTHTVDDDIADHWYVRLHVGEKPATAQASEGNDGELATLADQRAELDRLAKEADRLAALSAELDKREADLDGREDAFARRVAEFDRVEAERVAALASERGEPAKDAGAQQAQRKQQK